MLIYLALLLSLASLTFFIWLSYKFWKDANDLKLKDKPKLAINIETLLWRLRQERVPDMHRETRYMRREIIDMHDDILNLIRRLDRLENQT